MVFAGLIGMIDPPRAEAQEAVARARAAGIRPVMITGDHPATAAVIAAELGIATGGRVVTGPELEKMPDDVLGRAVQDVSVYARVNPDHKLRIVKALQRAGAIVAMTGDGVNDAPAIKAANIGIAMGGRGTDVAREAGALVLLNDEFSSIVIAVRLGRRIYDNLRKAIAYIVAVHVPIAGLALLPLLFGLPPMLLPIHIAILEMVIDPACSVVFEAEKEEPTIMRRPPRRFSEPVLPRRIAVWAASQGLCALAAVMLVLGLGLWLKLDVAELRAMVFAALVMTNIGLILVNRGFQPSLSDALTRPNPSFWLLVGATLLVLATTLFWAPGRALFGFGELQAWMLSVPLAASVLLPLVLEAAKRMLLPRLL
jgi:Ca2+-transporting ATPase